MADLLFTVIVAVVFLIIGYVMGVYKNKMDDSHYKDMKDFAHTFGNLSVSLINSMGKAPSVGYPEEVSEDTEEEEKDPGEYADLTGGELGR